MGDEITALFKQVDTTNDGKISLRELDRMFKDLQIKLTVHDVRGLVQKFDKDGNKKLDLKEFRALISDVFAADTAYNEAYNAFKMFDRDGSNTITAREIRVACANLDDKMSEQDINKMIKDMDTDGNGIIGFDEFAKAYACARMQ